MDPRNVYAATKLHQEHLCESFAREVDGCRHGPALPQRLRARMPRDTPYAGVASIFRSAVAAGRAPQVFEDGSQLRDFIDVRDVARANRLALLGEPAPGPSTSPRDARQRGRHGAALVAVAGAGAPAPVVTGAYRRGDVRHVFASAGAPATCSASPPGSRSKTACVISRTLRCAAERTTGRVLRRPREAAYCSPWKAITANSGSCSLP
jgi:dTDP-L-rhamnose 4-epimerase